jgi:uncharacterized protein YcbK (DUF882 family)
MHGECGLLGLQSHSRLSERPKAVVTFALGVVTFAATVCTASSTQTAIANGDTRTLSLFHSHTKESATVTFRRNGVYDADGLEKLNWALRDWRTNAPTKMDPRLFDIVWEVYRESGSAQPIVVVSAYRAPETNAMLRRRSSAVAKNSQHILGKAMDMHYVDVPMAKIRELGMRLQRGGVGYYPTSGTPFVHLDAGNVRAWPRMTYDQLARLFPDGKTVHLPSNGPPLPGYQQARAEIEARGDTEVASLPQNTGKGFFASLFGSADENDEEDGGAAGNSQRTRTSTAAATQVAAFRGSDDSRNFFATQGRITVADTVAKAQQNLPRGETVMSAPGETISSPQKPEVTASLAKPNSAADIEAVAPAVEAKTARSAPLPPRRPEIDPALFMASAAPLPPAKPVELAVYSAPPANARFNPISAALRDNDATGSIARAPADNSDNAEDKGDASSALAFASATPTAGQAPAGTPMTRALHPAATVKHEHVELVAARLDVANFHFLTGSASAASVQSQVALGPTVSPLRAAARLDAVSLAARPASGLAIHFGRNAGVLSSNGFAQH